MIFQKRFTKHLQDIGFKLATGVPCSYFSSLLQEIEASTSFNYINATNEGDAVAIACGSALSGKKSVVFMQNSGLGNAINPLTSLAIPYKIPLLLFISWRGNPEGEDPIHHELMGSSMLSLLKLMEIPYFLLEKEEDGLTILQIADKMMIEKRGPVAVIIKKGIFKKFELQETKGLFNRDDVLSFLIAHLCDNDLILTTTGYTCRSLHAIQDNNCHFYMMGSMGCISSLGLGIALENPLRRVIVIDGDGALLMRAGALATIGALKPVNLIHILLNNNSYESTGGQKSVAATVDFSMLARSMGYPLVKTLETLQQFKEILEDYKRALTFVEIKTDSTPSQILPRIKLDPSEIAERFSKNILNQRNL